MSFQNIFSKFFNDLSASQYLIYSKTIFVGSFLQGKLDHFDKKNLLTLIALVFLISLIIFDQRTSILSSTRFFIILMKNGFNMMCFLSKKVLLSRDNTVSCILRLKGHLIFFEGTIIWFDLLSFSNIAKNLEEKFEVFNPFNIILIKRQYS